MDSSAGGSLAARNGGGAGPRRAGVAACPLLSSHRSFINLGPWGGKLAGSTTQRLHVLRVSLPEPETHAGQLRLHRVSVVNARLSPCFSASDSRSRIAWEVTRLEGVESAQGDAGPQRSEPGTTPLEWAKTLSCSGVTAWLTRFFLASARTGLGPGSLTLPVARDDRTLRRQSRAYAPVPSGLMRSPSRCNLSPP